VRPVRESVSWEATLARLARHRLPVGTVVDVGASDGRWSRLVRPTFPGARYLLLDANPVHEPALRAYAASQSRTAYAIRAAGDYEGEVYFDGSHAFLGQASRVKRDEHHVLVPMTTLDAAVALHGCPPPYLLKLDTHGFELPILRGAARVLAEASILVIEAYAFRVGPEAPRFFELCQHLDALGFRVLDLCDPLHRPLDGALWQMDLVFARARPEDLDEDAYALFGIRRQPGRRRPAYDVARPDHGPKW
jgi:FkbM family methyltransferase